MRSSWLSSQIRLIRKSPSRIAFQSVVPALPRHCKNRVLQTSHSEQHIGRRAYSVETYSDTAEGVNHSQTSSTDSHRRNDPKYSVLYDREKNSMLALKILGGGRDNSGRALIKYGGLRDNVLARWYSRVEPEYLWDAEKWTVTLDGKLLISRHERLLLLPSEEMALAVASDWEAQSANEFISFSKLPIMQLAVKSLDDISAFRPLYEQELEEVLDTDNLCFEASEGTQIRKVQENSGMSEILHWFEEITTLRVEAGVSYERSHPAETRAVLKAWWKQLDNFSFIALHHAALLSKSVILPIALWHGKISAKQAVGFVDLEEQFQWSKHGVIEGATDLRSAVSDLDLTSAAVFLKVVPASPPSEEVLKPFREKYLASEKLVKTSASMDEI